MFFGRNPMYLIGLFYMYKKMMEKIEEWGEDESEAGEL